VRQVNGKNAVGQDDIPAGAECIGIGQPWPMEPRRSLLRIYFISATLPAFHIR
jgi:hypothetical protein